MTVRPYLPADFAEWHRMRSALWPDQTPEDMAAWLDRVDAHQRLGFTETGRGARYRKSL